MGLITISNGAGYTTASKVRNAMGLSATGDISDADLLTLIAYCSRLVSRDLTTRHFREKLSGTIDGSNAIFSTSEPFIADRDIDAAVTTADVAVYGVVQDDTTLTLTRSALTVSAIDAFTGKVTLSTAPATTNDWLEIDYESYRCPVYVDMLEHATNLLTAHFVVVRNKDPAKVTMAALMQSGGESGYSKNGVAWSQSSRFLVMYTDYLRRLRAGEFLSGE